MRSFSGVNYIMNCLYCWKDVSVSVVLEMSEVTKLISFSRSLNASSLAALSFNNFFSMFSFSFRLALLYWTNSMTLFLSCSNSRVLSPSACRRQVSLSLSCLISAETVRFLSSVRNISFFCPRYSERGTESHPDLAFADIKVLCLATFIAADIKLLFLAL